MRGRRFVALMLAAVFAVGGGFGAHLATRGDGGLPATPVSERFAPLERARAEGVIDSYRLVYRSDGTRGSRWEYRADSNIRIWSISDGFGSTDIAIEYRRSASAEGQAVVRLVRAYARRTGGRVIVSPPYG